MNSSRRTLISRDIHGEQIIALAQPRALTLLTAPRRAASLSRKRARESFTLEQGRALLGEGGFAFGEVGAFQDV